MTIAESAFHVDYDAKIRFELSFIIFEKIEKKAEKLIQKKKRETLQRARPFLQRLTPDPCAEFVTQTRESIKTSQAI